VLVWNNTIGVRVSNAQVYSTQFANSTVENNTDYTIWINNSANLTFTNVTFDDDLYIGNYTPYSYFWADYYTQHNVTDNATDPIGDVDVEVKDVYGYLHVNLTTASTGLTSVYVLPYYNQTNQSVDFRYYYSNYESKATKSGYFPNNVSTNISTNRITIDIVLKPSTFAMPSGIMLLEIYIMFCLLGIGFFAMAVMYMQGGGNEE
jgi:hypothetical protein